MARLSPEELGSMSDSQLRVLQDQISTLLQQRSGLSQQQQQPQQLPMQQQPQPQLDRHRPRSGPAAVEEVPSQEGSSPLGGGTSSAAPRDAQPHGVWPAAQRRDNGDNAFEYAGTCAWSVCLPRKSCRRRRCTPRPRFGFQKINDGGPTTGPILGPQGGTRLGSVCRFSVKGGGEKNGTHFCLISVTRGKSRVAVVQFLTDVA